MEPCKFIAPLLYLIVIFSFAKAQNDCPLFNETFLGSADELTSTGLVVDAFEATSGDPSPIFVQVHAAHIVCLRSGQTRDRFSGVSVIVNYTCTGPPTECTGSPTLSQFDFECIRTNWSASVDGSAAEIITTPPDGSFSTPRRSDCGVCISPMRAAFSGITNNMQHCGSCNPACSSSGVMRCFNRLESGCCNYYENNMCVTNCTSPRVPDVNFDCVLMNNTCHDAIDCGGNMVTGVNTAEECCLGSGLSFRNDSGVCRQCIVHGFDTTELELDEGASQQVIRVMLDVKGNTLMEPAVNRIQNFGFSFTCIDSSNGGGPQAVDPSDFTDTGCGSNIQLQLFPPQQRFSEVGITAIADDKIEGTEVLTQQLTLTSPTQDEVDNAGNIFFQTVSTITIIDVTVLEIGFSEDDYTADEGDDGVRPNTPCSVVVELIQTRLEIPLQVQLTPTARNATARDFNDTVIETEIPPGQTLLMQPIQIFDDEINEARENFEVALEIVSNISNVVMYRRRTTLCRIRQSDPIEIGFRLRRINHTEVFQQFDALIAKSRASEQTFEVQIEIGTLNSPFGQSATQGQDFRTGAGNVSVVVRQLAPEQNNIGFSYQIIADNTPENQEVFQLSVTPAIGSPAFTCTQANGCFQQLEVVIVDDDVVVVGFVETLIEVNETDGQATLNVSISSPAPDPRLRFEIMFSLRVNSMDGSAGSHSAIDNIRNPIPGVEDFPRIVDSTYFTFQEMPFDILEFRVLNEMFNATQQSQTFSFPILMDDVPEGVEELQLTLSLQEDPTLPPGSVNVTPAVATVRIHDFSSVVVGFESRIYTVGDRDGQVELCVNITVPRRQDIGTVTFNLTVETQDGTAVSPDDYTSVSMTLGTFTSQQPRQCFNISITDDASVQPTREFTARLALMDSSVTTISPDRIIVDPPETAVQITDSPTTPPPTTPPPTTSPPTTSPPTTPSPTTVPPSIRVNDTVTGDPLMTVPLNVGNETRMLLGLDENERVSLCYEVHGEANENFNLVSDVCVSVNAHYARVRSDVDINIIDQIGVRAVDSANQCHNIMADLNGCSASVDGVEITTSYRMGGISVRKYPTRVRIAVPNCEDHDLVMWVFCQTATFENGNMTFDAPMIRYVIARGFNLAETSHGILGQFWNIPINVVRYNEQIRGDVRADAYNITVNYPGQQRQFVGFLYSLNWELKEKWCLYVGNRQGGPINEVDNPNDPVLQGEYSDYKVDNIFGTEYAFGHFESARCMA